MRTGHGQGSEPGCQFAQRRQFLGNRQLLPCLVQQIDRALQFPVFAPQLAGTARDFFLQLVKLSHQLLLIFQVWTFSFHLRFYKQGA